MGAYAAAMVAFVVAVWLALYVLLRKKLAALSVALGALVWDGAGSVKRGAGGAGFTLAQFSAEFLNEYWLEFELTSVLLLAAIVAAIAVIQVSRRQHG